MTGVNDIGQVSGVEVLVHPGKQELSDAIAARLVTSIVAAQARICAIQAPNAARGWPSGGAFQPVQH